MGGYNSGRWGGRATVEATGCLRLDVNAVARAVRQALERAGAPPLGPGRAPATTLGWRWKRDGEPDPFAVVMVALRFDGTTATARLRYAIRHLSAETGPQDYTVAMEAEPCRFGGWRWWWVCPQTRRRCAILYLPNGGRRFLSRGAYRLAYQSQREDTLGRAHRRAARVHRRLGGEYRTSGDPLPPKPPRMRWATYTRLATQREAADEAFSRAWLAGVARIIARAHRR